MDYQNKLKNKLIKHAMLACVVASLCSCAATQTIVEHGHLSGNTKMSETIFLDPVSDKQKTAFISVKNTSDETIDFAKPLASALKANGYKLVKNPSAAHYLVQANVLKIGKMSKRASEEASVSKFGSTLAGVGTGVALGSLSNNADAMVAGGLIGGAASIAADALVKNVNYAMITDVQISEKTAHKIKQRTKASLKNGSTTNTVQDYSEESNYKRYRTRIVSNANKVNLKFSEAKPLLEHQVAKAIAGIF